jgi:gamma-glutamylcyclotransferase (GGCT)/AIG2-like uncharacterized protein YtfP
LKISPLFWKDGQQMGETVTANNRTIFVYGTLREACGHPMHELLAHHSLLMGEGSASGELYDLGDYPGILLRTGSDRRTHGELYEINPVDEVELWIALDDYEGCGPGVSEPHLYSRRLIPVTLKDGRAFEAWTYVLRELPPTAKPIPSGDYVAWKHLANADPQFV